MADLFGMGLPDLEDGEMAVSAVVLVKTMDEHGEMWLRHYLTDGLSKREALGTVVAYEDEVRYELLHGYTVDAVNDDD